MVSKQNDLARIAFPSTTPTLQTLAWLWGLRTKMHSLKHCKAVCRDAQDLPTRPINTCRLLLYLKKERKKKKGNKQSGSSSWGYLLVPGDGVDHLPSGFQEAAAQAGLGQKRGL